MSGYATPPCPLDPAHGRLVDWATEKAAWYCPSRAHEGFPAFYDSDLVAVTRSDDGTAPSRRQSTRSQRVGGRPG